MKQFLILQAFLSWSAASSEPRQYTARILRTLPHQGAPFTQGLELANENELIETSGAYPPGTDSFVRTLDLRSGSILHSTKSGLSGRFAEDVARTPDGWLVATYHDRKALRFNSDLSLDGEVEYPLEEGWGLAHDAQRETYFATNGSASMMMLDAHSLALKRVAPIMCMGHKVPGMNELEFVEDFDGQGPTLFGNLYKTRYVIGMDPTTFECTSFFDLEGFGEEDANEQYGFHVANGIAYLPNSKTFMVTGKNWQNMFEISLEATGAAQVEKLRRKLQRLSRQSASLVSLTQIPELPPVQDQQSASVRRMRKRYIRRQVDDAIGPDALS
mmetsp:Transcript_48776/g.113897  ORF Transcript_48776/g.113897 Transcript_48776/m.113897 type:complete len:329 (+) Transcript_48776:79-1065(+)